MSENLNEQFIVTARKWRPMRFEDIVGQEHVTTTLRNALRSGRIHHAYLFNGPRGVGKTTTARVMARAVNCPNRGEDAEPCNVCPACREVVDGRSMDVIEIDGASNNSVDDIRKLRENAKYPPVAGQYKMYIIDEVHMLSTSAFNALLKTLEEPPPHLLFVFATTEPHKLPATIISRCQRFDFRRMEIETIVRQIRYIAGKEGIELDEQSLVAIAKKAEGSMRDSQSVFDQVVAFCGRDIKYADVNEALHLIDQEFFFTVSRAIREHDVPKMFEISREVLSKGYDTQEFLNGLLEHFRNILTVLATGSTKLIETSSHFLEKYEIESAYFIQPDVLRLMTLITSTENALKHAPQPRIRFETALVQMATMDSAVEITQLLKEIELLKKAGIPQQNNNQQSIPQSQQFPPQNVQPHTTQPAVPKSEPVLKDSSVNYSAQPESTFKNAEIPAKKIDETKTAVPNVAGSDAFKNEAAAENVGTDNYASAADPVSESFKKPGVTSPQGDISAGKLQAGWPEFVQSLAGDHKPLQYLIQYSASLKPQFLNGEIILHFGSKFESESFKDLKGELIAALAKFFNASVNLHLSVGTMANGVAKEILPRENFKNGSSPDGNGIATKITQEKEVLKEVIPQSPSANLAGATEFLKAQEKVEQAQQEAEPPTPIERHPIEEEILKHFSNAREVVVPIKVKKTE
ncbi:MAG TPA: DNA polymerase III subunit gamma/tau [Patescibacteria group bacterium]|nr:DNA polymerase III subunit gamma/tau [Patescibacteria group bacterium]